MKYQEFILSEKEYRKLSHFLPEIEKYNYIGGIEDLGDIDILFIPIEKIELIERIKSFLEEYRILRSYEFSLELFQKENLDKLFLKIKKNFGKLKIYQIKYEYLDIFEMKKKEYYSIQIKSKSYQDRENFYLKMSKEDSRWI